VAPAAKPIEERTGSLRPPNHVAIIMDGNGRWARERGLPRTLGHRQGVEAVRRAVRAAIELKITYLTIFSFSSENWKRPVEEIDDLMGLMKRFIWPSCTRRECAFGLSVSASTSIAS
jgi:undecaprenyl diphosphate synthase